MKVDYLIAGGGLCGMLLSRSLMKMGATVLVVDDNIRDAASKVAGGIINPVTGMRLVSTWMADELLAGALQCYRELEVEIGLPIVRESELLDFYSNREQQQIFETKAKDGNRYLYPNKDDSTWNDYFRFNYGVGIIAPCLLVDIRGVLNGISEQLKQRGWLLTERFEQNALVVNEHGVVYKDIEAKKVLFCEGADGAENRFFGMLPWSKDKGEVIIAEIPGLPTNHIYRQQLNIIPWKDGLFWIGTSHDWKYTHLEPTAAYRVSVEQQLNYWLKLPYTIVDHLVGRRPANLDRKPFVGMHPKYEAVGIFNGMGGKGVSMAPFFAEMLAANLVTGSEIMKDVDVRRFAKVLMR